MFDLVQKYKRFIQIIIILIVVTFATWGLESYTGFGGQAGTVATVDGIAITEREFEQELREQQERLRQMFGGAIDVAALDTPETRRALLDSMIEQRVVASAVVREGLTVSDDTLREAIAAIPAFQRDGQFSRESYDLVLRSQNPPLTPAQFEARMRYDLALAQLGQAVRESAIAPKSVVERLATLESQKREIAEARVAADPFLPQVKVDEAELKKYYEANQAEFLRPERVRAEYVVLSAQALAGQEDVTDAEIKAAYEARASQYKVEEQRRASHILVKTREEAEKLLAEATKSPARFAELAKKHSQDPGSAEKGGDLGWFGRAMMAKPFEDAVFGMKDGEIAGPVETEFGFHVVRLTGVQAPRARPLEEVRKEIAEDLARQKGTRRFLEAAEAFSNMVYEQADSLKPAAERFKLKVQTTGWVSRSAAQELGALDHPKLLAALFSPDSITNRRNTDAIEVAPNTLVSARVVEHQPAAQRSFEEVSAEIAEKLRRRQAAALAQKAGAEKLEQLRKGEDAGLKWGPVRTVSRRDAQGLPPQALQKVVSADASKLPAYVGIPVPEAGYILIRISKVIDDAGRGDKQKADDAARIARVLGSAQYEAVVADLRKLSDIEINAEKLEKKQQP